MITHQNISTVLKSKQIAKHLTPVPTLNMFQISSTVVTSTFQAD